MKEYLYEDIEVGLVESFCREITLEMENIFRALTIDLNPLHEDDEYAKTISGGKYEQHVTFGMLTASLLSTLAGMYLPGKYSLIHSIETISFLKPVFVGDVLTVTGEVVGKNDALRLLQIKVIMKNQCGKTVLKGKMKILVMK